MKYPIKNVFQFLTLNYAAQEDLMDAPFYNSDMEIFSDGSSFVQDGKWRKGYAMAVHLGRCPDCIAGCASLTPPAVRKGFPHLGWSLEFYGLLVAACPAVLASTGRGWTSGCRKRVGVSNCMYI